MSNGEDIGRKHETLRVNGLGDECPLLDVKQVPRGRVRFAATAKQEQANQKNALNSTGPKTEAGKSIVAGNATKHGILSHRLILADESEEEFQCLFDSLCESLRPAGQLELVLVEKIAMNVWRQRRLVRAEQAGIELSRQPGQIAEQVSNRLGMGAYSPRRLTVDDLDGIDTEQVEWCEGVLRLADAE